MGPSVGIDSDRIFCAFFFCPVEPLLYLYGLRPAYGRLPPEDFTSILAAIKREEQKVKQQLGDGISTRYVTVGQINLGDVIYRF